jgi:hypothetical protein
MGPPLGDKLGTAEGSELGPLLGLALGTALGPISLIIIVVSCAGVRVEFPYRSKAATPAT